MAHIVLTEEQLRILTETQGPVDVRDPQGQPIASLSRFTPEDIAALERYRRNRGKPQVGIPAEQVQAHFRRLEEIKEAEGMDLPKALDLLRRMQAGEQV